MPNNLMAHIEQCVNNDLQGARIMAVMEWNHTEREDYWEREYIVAWRREGGVHQYGTHRAHVNSEGRTALFIGHYCETPGDAIADFYKRIGVKE